MQADILRDKFLQFFKSKGHKIVASDSLVPKDDPTVLFTPAGMNQFKKEFLGYDSGFKRAATSQRCLRTDDLEKVGKTSSHHTFFEMLGNFSFGDYFKEEAILWSWEFLLKELKIKEDKLWVSVYKEDTEAYTIWKDKVGLPEKKIVRLGDKDNFWPAEAKTKGPNGPCGPCSEIFYDFGADVGCKEMVCDPSCSCGRFVEIWNLVFTQFNRKDNGVLEPLPNKNIDTGMGLERLTAITEEKHNNFETELFQPVIKEIKREAVDCEQLSTGVLYAIADHIRAIVFSIYDGVMPSNEGRGYVIRKLIRKSVLNLRAIGFKKPFLNRLVALVAEIMHKPYPDLKDRQESIAAIILNEEKTFINTLSSTQELFRQKFSILKNKGEADTAGKIAFELYDTYGIPLDLTKDWLKAEGISFNENVFYQELNAQRDRSRVKSSMKGDVFDVKGLGLKIGATQFIGYDKNSNVAKVEAMLKDGKEIDSALAGDELQVILNETCFYPESGGQVGDTGEISNGTNVLKITDTKKLDNVILHIGKVKFGSFKKGDTVKAAINTERRLLISCNHTATHILQAALRKILGDHVQQQGSLVTESKLRFDFTHFKPLTKEELVKVEEVANSCILKNLDVRAAEMELKEAKRLKALAFFAEKYSEKVRVISVGDISLEFCGGAHLSNTTDIGLIKIVHEGSVASGIRRIEAVTAECARAYIQEEIVKASEESKKREELLKLKEEGKKAEAKAKLVLEKLAYEILSKVEKLKNINFIHHEVNDLDMAALRRLTDLVKEKSKSSVIVLGAKELGRAYLVIGVTDDLLSKGFDALMLIKKAAELIGGSGGGRKDFAQAGGSKPENFRLAFDEVKGIIIALTKEGS